MAVRDAAELQNDTHIAFLTTPPTTLAGIAALLEHAGTPCFPEEEGSEGNESILESASLCYRTDVRDAGAAFLPMITEALRELLPQVSAVPTLAAAAVPAAAATALGGFATGSDAELLALKPAFDEVFEQWWHQHLDWQAPRPWMEWRCNAAP
jgi:hypothetical protein